MNPDGDGRVVCPQPLAAAAAGAMLERGGNALDAAVTAALAQGVVDPMMCGLGGTARILLYTADTGRTELFGAMPYAGRLAVPDCYEYEGQWAAHADRHDVKGAAHYLGHTAAVVPTALRVLYDTQQARGRVPWHQVVEPAIRFAHDGFEVYPYLYRHWDEAAEAAAGDYGPSPKARLSANEEAASIYLRDGQVLSVGELLHQQGYGRTLEQIANDGADVFYRGPIADSIAHDFAANGGFVTREDLYSAETAARRTYSGTYGGAMVITDGPPAAGPSYIMALNIFEALRLRPAANSVEYWLTLAETFHTVYAFRARHNGDPDWIDVPIDRFLSKDEAQILAGKIGAVPESVEGLIPVPKESTTSVSVVDSAGNGAVITHSNGSCSGVVTPGLGFLYNNHMHNFDPRPGQRNSIAFGKIPSHGTPLVMWFRNAELIGMSGSLSRFAFTADLAVTLAVMHGVDLQSAIAAPRLHSEYKTRHAYVEPEFPPTLTDELAERGWTIQRRPMTAPLGMLWQQNGKIRVARDPRGDAGCWPPDAA